MRLMSVWGTEDMMSEIPWRGTRRKKIRIDRKTRITVLSGAGISAESGIPTFRGADGLWNDENLVRIATPRGFSEDPVRGWNFYNERRINMAKAEPNPAHVAIAELEREGYDVKVITQNVDRLHQRAGSTKVIELHGTVWELRCSNSRCTLEPFENSDVPLEIIPPLCERCGAHLRPNVVFFEEMLSPDVVHAADRRTKVTDVLLVIGTSGVVYPAAAFVQVARACGAYVMEFNIETTPLSPYCDISILGPCGETLPATIREMTGEGDSVE